MFVLEVQKFVHPRDEGIPGEEWNLPQNSGRWGSRHQGYMDKLFRTKKAAGLWYDSHTRPFMRSLNAHGTWTSDHHPETNMRCKVREYDDESRVLSEEQVIRMIAP